MVLYKVREVICRHLQSALKGTYLRGTMPHGGIWSSHTMLSPLAVEWWWQNCAFRSRAESLLIMKMDGYLSDTFQYRSFWNESFLNWIVSVWKTSIVRHNKENNMSQGLLCPAWLSSQPNRCSLLSLHTYLRHKSTDWVFSECQWVPKAVLH